MATHVYHWKHGWIPLDHVALSSGGHRSQATGPIRGDHARTGIKTRRHVAHAAATIHKVPAGPDRQHAAAHLKASAVAIGAQDLVTPKTAAHRAADQARTAKARQVTPDEHALFAGGSAARHLVHHPDGSVTFTPQRQALHDRIIANALAGNTPVAHPAYNVMGGGPAAGKSTMEKRTPQLRDNAALINPDEMKAQLPEYAATTDGTAAVFTHEESSYLAKRAVAEAFARRINVTLDGTGDSNPDSLRGKLAAARAAGYSVNGYYVTVDTSEAVRRANLRGQRSGRFVPESVVRGTHENVSRVLPQMVDQFDHLQVFDNNQATIRLIGEKPAGGQFHISEPQLWADFLAKDPGHQPARVRVTASSHAGQSGHMVSGTSTRGQRVRVFAPGGRGAADQAAANIKAGRPAFSGSVTVQSRLATKTPAQLRASAARTKNPALKRAILAELARRPA